MIKSAKEFRLFKYVPEYPTTRALKRWNNIYPTLIDSKEIEKNKEVFLNTIVETDTKDDLKLEDHDTGAVKKELPEKGSLKVNKKINKDKELISNETTVETSKEKQYYLIYTFCEE